MIIDSNHRATGNGSRRRESSQVALRVVPRIIIVYRKNQDVDISQFTSWFLYCIAGNSSTLYAALYFTAFYQPCVATFFPAIRPFLCNCCERICLTDLCEINLCDLSVFHSELNCNRFLHSGSSSFELTAYTFRCCSEEIGFLYTKKEP